MICGVPQGSILGPLLFVIFINDLCYSASLIEAILFADDTNLFYSHNKVKELIRTMNAEPKHLNYWFCANKLSLNTEKTKSVLFHKAKRLEVKNLGVMIDENLTWKTHVELVENEISNSVGILSKASRSLNSESLQSIFFALVHPYMNYANFA